jgi:hypothetical protein
MGEESDQFKAAVEAKLQAEFGCAESDAERVAAAVARACEADADLDWHPTFVVETLTHAPREYSVPEKWNWLADRAGQYLGTDADLDEYRVEE